ncbi:MAG: hypothetical protein WBG77_15260 [Acinetobacter venetianus]|uniref:hypothetical protein n=1 Tax=Acinetobacter venetianus TaxID=52133 RepID=UPI003C721EC1
MIELNNRNNIGIILLIIIILLAGTIITLSKSIDAIDKNSNKKQYTFKNIRNKSTIFQNSKEINYQEKLLQSKKDIKINESLKKLQKSMHKNESQNAS